MEMAYIYASIFASSLSIKFRVPMKCELYVYVFNHISIVIN